MTRKTGEINRSATLKYPSLSIKPGFHIVVSVVSVVRKKFIGQIELILSFNLVQHVVSVISVVLSSSTGGFHKVVFVL